MTTASAVSRTTIPTWRTNVESAAAALLPLLLGLVVDRQGFNLLDDGLWALGGKVLSEGGALYRDLFSIYGPGRYVLLLPFVLVAGKSALALALGKAVTAAAAGLLGFRFARRLGARGWAWLIPLGVVALGPVQPRYVAAVGLAWLAATLWMRRPGWWGGFCLGLAWGALCSFGLDAAGFGTVTLGLGALLAGRARPGRTTWWGTAAGLGVALLIMGTAAAISGALGAAIWDAVVYPATRFTRGMGVSWFAYFRHGSELGQPFAELMTGEELPAAWAGQADLRALAWRLLYLTLWLPAPLAWWRGRRRGEDDRDAALRGTLVACAIACWVTLLGRGDTAHLRMAWYASLVLLPALLTKQRSALQVSGRWLRAGGVLAGGLFALLALGPLAAEKLWLAFHADRPTLCAWERPGARILMACARRDALESLYGSLPRRPDDPLLVWPVQPGLHVLFDAPLATSQATLLAGEVRDPRAVIAELDRRRPSVALVGRAGGVLSGVRSVRQLAPDLWAYLRLHYRVDQLFTAPGNEYWVLARLPADREAPGTLPLAQQLPDAEQRVANQLSPPLRPGVSIGQTFQVGPLDLQGIALRWAAAEPPVSCTVRFQLWELQPGSSPASLGSWERQVHLEHTSELVTIDFGSRPRTAGRELAVSCEVLEEVPGGIFLGWHVPQPGERYEDFYPEGTALLDGRPVAGDLYFLTY
jgi:hypothetical protein